MARPYSLFKRSNGIYYAQFPAPEGGMAFQKSTGARTRSEVENIVLSWYTTGVIQGTSLAQAEESSRTSIERQTFLAQLRHLDFNERERGEIVEILKRRGYILSAVLPRSKESRSVEDFLAEFWDYDTSPYVKEKLLKGQSIHRDYCMTMADRPEELAEILPSCVGKHWVQEPAEDLFPCVAASVVFPRVQLDW